MRTVTPAKIVSTLTPARTVPSAGKTAASHGSGSRAVQQFSAKISGHTITYSATVSGAQHSFQADDGTVMPYGKPATMTVSFGDGTRDEGGDAGMQCTTKGAVNTFSEHMTNKSHTYAKAGTYTVTVRTTYCADAGATTKTSTYQVTVR